MSRSRWQGGDLLVVGAYNATGIGAAYVFERFGTSWQQTARLTASSPHSGMNFGWAVATDGYRVAVGARDENNRGAAYVFESVGGVWSQKARLVASDGQTFDFFGKTIAIDGDTVMVGSSADAPGGSSQGAAYVYEFNGVTWSQTQKLYNSDGLANDDFSNFQIALQGNTALVGALNHDHGLPNSGAAYVFERVGSSWTQAQELRSHAPNFGARFGSNMAIHGDIAVCGAARDPYLAPAAGVGYVFRRSVGRWEHVGCFTPNIYEPNGLFGSHPIAFNGREVIAGQPRDDGVCPTNSNCNSGAVYVFELAPDARQFGWCMGAAPCANTFEVGGCRNSTGLGSRLAAAGSSSVALDELRFEVRDMQPNKNAILFMGAGIGQAVLGDGLRVVASGGTGFYRFGVSTAGVDGSFQRANVISHSQGFAPTGRIQPGSVWNFQCWHRDPAGPCGSGTNLTNAVEVLFRP